MAIRSGRFKFTGAGPGSAQVIIKSGKVGAFYRIFNSGDKQFKVRNGTSDTQLDPTFSLDLIVVGEVAISGNAGEEVEGIYEYLDNQIVGQTLRSGRFSFTDVNATSHTHKIIDLSKPLGQANDAQAYYRILNSGEPDFQVWNGEPSRSSSEELGSVKKGQALDFGISAQNGKKDIWVKGPALIEGIYDFLGT